MLAQLAQGPEQVGWWLHFVELAGGEAGRTLIGHAGYKGPPSSDGTVELGYSIVGDHQRQGYASVVACGLLAQAFDVPTMRPVIAETLPVLVASVDILHKRGFRPIGKGSEAGVIRFELTGAEYAAANECRLANVHPSPQSRITWFLPAPYAAG